MRSKFDPTPLKDQRIRIAIDEESKRKVFEAAARKGVSPSQFIRESILRAANSAARAEAA